MQQLKEGDETIRIAEEQEKTALRKIKRELYLVAPISFFLYFMGIYLISKDIKGALLSLAMGIGAGFISIVVFMARFKKSEAYRARIVRWYLYMGPKEKVFQYLKIFLYMIVALGVMVLAIRLEIG